MVSIIIPYKSGHHVVYSSIDELLSWQLGRGRSESEWSVRTVKRDPKVPIKTSMSANTPRADQDAYEYATPFDQASATCTRRSLVPCCRHNNMDG